MRWIDRFCQKHPRFGIRNLMMFLVVSTVAVYLFSMLDTTDTFIWLLNFNPVLILRGQVWRILTFMIVPMQASPVSLFIFLYFYYSLGSALESAWGKAKFTLYYLTGIVSLSLFSLFFHVFFHYHVSVNAHYFNMSILFSYAALNPDGTIMLYGIIPLKAKWLAAFNLIYFLYDTIQLPFPLNLLPLFSTLNFLIFCWDDITAYIRGGTRRKPRGAVDFKQAVRKIKREEKTREYNRKCSVCGKTDVSHPDLAFRYCSRCEGYHCFCQEHINDHTHFSE